MKQDDKGNVWSWTGSWNRKWTAVNSFVWILFVSSWSVQLCQTLYDPMDCSPPGSSVHGNFQARILELIAIAPSGDLPSPGIEPASSASPALAGGFFTSEPPGKPMRTNRGLPIKPQNSGRSPQVDTWWGGDSGTSGFRNISTSSGRKHTVGRYFLNSKQQTSISVWNLPVQSFEQIRS